MAFAGLLLFCGTAILNPQSAAAQAFAEINLGQPSPGYTYFNRAGASKSEHDAAIDACLLDAKEVAALGEYTGANSGLMGFLEMRSPAQSARTAAVENCMVVRGWRVVALAEDEGKALSELGSAALSAALEPLVGSAEPRGSIIRTWRNDALNSANIRSFVTSESTQNGALSLQSIGTFASVMYERFPQSNHGFQAHRRFDEAYKPDAVNARAPPPRERVRLDRDTLRLMDRDLTPDRIGSIPQGWAVILVRLTGVSNRNGLGLTFEVTGGTLISAQGDRLVNSVRFGVGNATDQPDRTGVWLMRAVPAGTYRLAFLDTRARPRGYVTAYGVYARASYCLGAPAFSLEPGEIVFAGAFDFSSTSLAPNLELSDAQNMLSSGGVTHLVRAAQYTNGHVAHCGRAMSIYALEFPDVPFVEGYGWGSRATLATAQVPTINGQ